MYRTVYSCELGLFFLSMSGREVCFLSNMSGRESSVEKLFDAYATDDGSMREERFKELVHEHCVTFGTRKDVWAHLSRDGKISKWYFLDVCSRPSFKVVMLEQQQEEWWTLRIISTSQEFTCQIPYKEYTGLERYMSHVANLSIRFLLNLNHNLSRNNHQWGRTKRATCHPAHGNLHIPDSIILFQWGRNICHGKGFIPLIFIKLRFRAHGRFLFH